MPRLLAGLVFIDVAMAQEGSGIAFDPIETGSEWAELLSVWGLLVALGGGVVLFAIRSWLWPLVRSWFCAPWLRIFWPTAMLAILVTILLFDCCGQNVVVESLVMTIGTLTLPLNLPGLAACALVMAGLEEWFPNLPGLVRIGVACCTFWVAEFLFFGWLRSRILDTQPVRLELS